MFRSKISNLKILKNLQPPICVSLIEDIIMKKKPVNESSVLDMEELFQIATTPTRPLIKKLCQKSHSILKN